MKPSPPRRALLAVLLPLLAAAVAGQATPAVPTVPADFDVVDRSIPELQNAMRTGALTARRLTEAYLERIEAYDTRGPALNTMIALNPQALETAEALDRERARTGPRSSLHGIPIVVKDNFETIDLPTTAGTLALEGYTSGRDAFQVRKLRDAGAIILGKTNLHELAYGITSISSVGGQTRNPYDPSRNPGGSSGGTAAAVAASLAAAGMGTDTCGSIRIPAAHNSLVGLRVTPGLSSRHGIVPLSSSQDVAGPLTRSVIDLAIILDATVGADPGDPVTQSPGILRPRSYVGSLGDRSLGWARVGIVTSLFGSAPEDEEVAAITRRAVELLRTLGADVFDVALPELPQLLQGTSLINAELKFDLADYFSELPKAPVRTLADILAVGRHNAVVDGVLRRAEAIASRDSEETRMIHERRAALRNYVITAMSNQGIDVLAYPPIRRVAAPIGEPQPGSNCQLSAATALPAISVPAGFTAAGLPVGLELLGGEFRESGLLAMAYSYEQVLQPRRPPSATPPLAR